VLRTSKVLSFQNVKKEFFKRFMFLLRDDERLTNSKAFDEALQSF